jgi:hypothetical protein
MDRLLVAAPLLLLGLLSSCGGGAPPADPSAASAQAPAASAAPASAPVDEKGKTAAAIEKLTADEAKSGTCDAQHQAALDKLLADVEAGMKGAKDEDDKPVTVKTVGKKVLALGQSPKSFEMSVTGRGTEVHVIAFGAKDVSMDVLVGTAAATTLRSPFQRTAVKEPVLDVSGVGRVTEVQSDSRQVVVKPGQPLVVKVTGQGCAGIISFLRQ